MQLINDQWVEFSKNVIPEDAPPVQREEMERAFYGGATIILSIMKDLSSNQIPHDEMTRIWKSLLDEAISFSKKQICEADYKLMENPIGHG